ncbi:hypothetical protein [Kitasatospora kifunensis]|uniref:Uncharacterized protein n=1 Tax=Kitasatospora kifunensis TaxID=58351 RepID=A0A7W7QYI7_KITKI|nr:hypothetical protein [Kitasatospora kifunensis]MBB4922176.1 hypothetical protein [Kitasatospora kifunensis]
MHDALPHDELVLRQLLGLTPEQVASLPDYLRVFIREFLAA